MAGFGQSGSQSADLAVYYEHPQWFQPLFRVLDQRGVAYVPIQIQDHIFDPSDAKPPTPVVFNRLAMSSFVRQSEHAIYYSQAVLAHWAANGARVINGASVMAIDANKARQLSLFRRLGLDIPATRVAHRREDLARAAEGLRFPIVIKANVGGAGVSITRYECMDDLKAAIADQTTPTSIDGVLLAQEYVPAENKRIIRCETLNGKFLYAIALNGAGSTFDLCPADVCMVDKPTITIDPFTPPARMIAAAEAVAKAVGLDVGGIEYMIDERDGAARSYDINALSNFVAEPLKVLGYDPHEQLVDFLQAEIAAKRANA